jgi:Phage integrase family
MAKPGKYGELNWHPKRKHWYKKIKNDSDNYVPKRFGPNGKSPNDRACKKAALKDYAEYKQKLAAQTKVKEFTDSIALVDCGALPVSVLGDSPWAQRFIEDRKQKHMLTGPDKDGEQYVNTVIVDPDRRDPYNDEDWEDLELPEDCHMGDPEEVIAARRRVMQEDRDRRVDYAWRVKQLREKPASSSRSKKPTISSLVDDWLADEEKKVKAEQIKPASLVDKEKGIRTFTSHEDGFGIGSKPFGKPEQVDQMVLDYRGWILDAMVDPKSGINSPETVNTKTKFCGQFIRWSWRRGHLKHLPRTLDELVKELKSEAKSNPLTVGQVHNLWDTANPRWQALLAIALNCGFKEMDISGLTGANLVDGRLLDYRSKTGEAMNYKLWPVTKQLIAQERDRTGAKELLFVNRTGGRITTGSMSNVFKKIAKRAGVKCTFENLRDTGSEMIRPLCRKTAGVTLEQLTEYQAHRVVKPVDRKYLSNHPEEARSPKLDKITDMLGKQLGLKLDASSAKAPAKKKAAPKPKAKSPKTKTPSHPELAHLRK